MSQFQVRATVKMFGTETVDITVTLKGDGSAVLEASGATITLQAHEVRKLAEHLAPHVPAK